MDLMDGSIGKQSYVYAYTVNGRFPPLLPDSDELLIVALVRIAAGTRSQQTDRKLAYFPHPTIGPKTAQVEW